MAVEVMQQTATELNVALRDIQAEAQRISPGDPISSCQINYHGVIAKLRDQVLPDASSTADFVITNIFSELLDDPSSSIADKLTAIDNFRNAPVLRRKSNIARGALQDMQQLEGLLNNGQDLLIQAGANPIAILNRFNIIVNGVQSIIEFYDKIGQIITQIRGIVAAGNDPAQRMNEETKWLAAVSLDYKAFRPNV